MLAMQCKTLKYGESMNCDIKNIILGPPAAAVITGVHSYFTILGDGYYKQVLWGSRVSVAFSAVTKIEAQMRGSTLQVG